MAGGTSGPNATDPRAPGTPRNGPGWRVRVVPNKFPALAVEGQLETRKWQEQSGQDRYSTEVVLRPYNSTLTMLDGRDGGGGGGGTFGGGGDNTGYDDRDSYGGDSGGSSGGGKSSPSPSRDLDDEIPF